MIKRIFIATVLLVVTCSFVVLNNLLPKIESYRIHGKTRIFILTKENLSSDYYILRGIDYPLHGIQRKYYALRVNPVISKDAVYHIVKKLRDEKFKENPAIRAMAFEIFSYEISKKHKKNLIIYWAPNGNFSDVTKKYEKDKYRFKFVD